MRLSPLYLTFLFDLCLLGLASFPWSPFVLDFLEILFQRGRMWDQSKLSGSKVGRGKLCVNIGGEDQKRGRFVLGGVWMMVNIQASVSGSNFVNFHKFMLALVALS
jgi:hypothetical protein